MRINHKSGAQTPFFPLGLLVVAYIMVGIGPLFVASVKDMSPFTIAFYRFFGASCFEAIIAMILFILLKVQLNRIKVKVSYPVLVAKCVKQYYLYPNYLIKNRSQLLYLVLNGFIVAGILLPGEYFGFALAGVTFTITAVVSLPIIILAIINWIRKEEEMDALKIIYLILLMAAVLTIGYSSTSANIGSQSVMGIIAILITSFSSVIFFMGLNRDPSQRIPMLAKVPGFTHRTPAINQTVSMLSAVFKIFGIHFFGSLQLILVAGFLSLIAGDSYVGLMGKEFITLGLPGFFTYIQMSPFLLLMLIGTAIPYILVMYSSVIWPRTAQKHDLWVSIISLAEPVVGVYIGYFAWHEAIRVDYLLFTTLFLIATIVIRYFSETSNLRTFTFLINLVHGKRDYVIDRLRPMKEIDLIDFLAGKHSLFIKLTVRAIKKLDHFVEFIDGLPGVASFTYSLENKYF